MVKLERFTKLSALLLRRISIGKECRLKPGSGKRSVH